MIEKTFEERIKQQAAVRTLVDIARSGLREDLRHNLRFPFFQPVTIASEEGGTVSLSAFSRDISEAGMGLLLYWPLRRRAVRLRVHFGEDEEISLTGHVQWCESCGHGWYVAGVTFLEGDSDDFTYTDSSGRVPPT